MDQEPQQRRYQEQLTILINRHINRLAEVVYDMIVELYDLVLQTTSENEN